MQNLTSSAASALYTGVIRDNGQGQTLLASIFAAKASLNKSTTERHFIEQASKEKTDPTLRSKSNIGTSSGQMWIIYDQATGCFIATAAEEGFSDRLAWDVLRDAAAEIQKHQGDIASSNPLGLNKPIRDAALKIMNGAKDDKLAQAQLKIDNTKAKMNENMEKMVENYDNMGDLEQQCNEMEADTLQYQNKAKKFQFNTLKQYWMLWAAVITVILIIIVSLIAVYA